MNSCRETVRNVLFLVIAEDRDNAIFQGLHGFKMASGETPPYWKTRRLPWGQVVCV